MLLTLCYSYHINLSSKSQGLGACLAKKARLPVVFWLNKGKGAWNCYIPIKGNFLIIIEVVLALILCRLLADQVIYTPIAMSHFRYSQGHLLSSILCITEWIPVHRICGRVKKLGGVILTLQVADVKKQSKILNQLNILVSLFLNFDLAEFCIKWVLGETFIQDFYKKYLRPT